MARSASHFEPPKLGLGGRNGQVTVLALMVFMPTLSVALLGLAFLGVRAQQGRAQTAADLIALTIARDPTGQLAQASPSALEKYAGLPTTSLVDVTQRGSVVAATVSFEIFSLHLPFFSRNLDITVIGQARARGQTLEDGVEGARLLAKSE